MGILMEKYPKFEPNQILTNAQLNQLHSHLMTQERLTRTRLIGTGKVCGLNWSISDDKSSIDVTEGFGVTSDGYLIGLSETTIFKYYRNYRDPGEDENDLNTRYELWKEDETKNAVLELFDEKGFQSFKLQKETKQDSDTFNIEEPVLLSTLKNLTSYVLVLYLEEEPEELNSCLVTACDNKGHNICLNVRAVLIPRTDLDALDECGPPPVPFSMPRLHVLEDLKTIESASQISQGYGAIVEKFTPGLMGNIIDAIKTYATFLGLGQHELMKIPDLPEQFNGAGPTTQYHYDELKDLGYAYNEFMTAACALHVDCCPDSKFSRHLLNGALNGEKGFCHEYQPSPVGNVAHGDLVLVRKLLLRLTLMAHTLKFKNLGNSVRITPSHTELYPLGKRALPYYFNITSKKGTELVTCWQPVLCCTPDRFWSYHNGDIESEVLHGDLLFDYTQCSFLRIEGHVGLSEIDALKNIEHEKTTYNVEFDVIRLYLTDTSKKEDVLKKKQLNTQNTFELALKKWRKIYWDALRAGKLPSVGEQLAKVAEEIESVRKLLLVDYQSWVDLRCARPLLCAVNSLNTEYRTFRETVFCVLSQLRGMIPESSLQLKNEDKENPNIVARLQSMFVQAVDWIHRHLHALNAYLPQELCGFHYQVFLAQYKILSNDVLWFNLVVTYLNQYREFQPDSTIDPKILTYLDRAKGDDVCGFQHILQNCAYLSLGHVAVRYEDVYRNDLRLFKRFAAAYPGLVHVAGVEKGGTFILVCEQGHEAKTSKVVADFSLSGKISCCCPSSAEPLCFPPVALPDYLRVPLVFNPTTKQYDPVKTDIDVRRNDYDSYQPISQIKKAPSREGLEVEVSQNAETELGGTVEISETGVIRYLHKNPIPGVVDRFSYTLKRKLQTEDRLKPCPGEDTGHVLILFTVPFEAPTKPKTGNIRGQVVSVEGGSAPGSLVVIQGANLEAIADAKGEVFFENLAPGSYSLVASRAGQTSLTSSVSVEVGQTAFVQLLLRAVEPEVGAISGVVWLDPAREVPAGSSRVRILNTGKEITTGDDGAFRFDNLSPGKYDFQAFFESENSAPLHNVSLAPGEEKTIELNLTGSRFGKVLDEKENPVAKATVIIKARKVSVLTDDRGRYHIFKLPFGKYVLNVSAQGFVAQEAEVTVTAGLASERDFVLKQASIVGVIPNRFIAIVSEGTGLQEDKARQKVQDLYGNRYNVRIKELAESGSDPEIKESAPYTHAQQFMTEITTDASLKDNQVINFYQEVSRQLVESIAGGNNLQKSVYRKVLTTVSLAYLDRLTITNPDKLNAQLKKAVTDMKTTVQESGIKLSALKGSWNGAKLHGELKIKGPQAIERLL